MSTQLHPVDAQRAQASQLTAFAQFVSGRTGERFDSYGALHAFSVRELEQFWTLFLEWSGARADGARAPAMEGDSLETTRFFPNLSLSWPEHLLAPRAPAEEDAVALISCAEDGTRVELTRSALRAKVLAIARALKARGLRPGDRVAAVARNTAETLIACLAATSLGASWSSVAPDMGLDSALSRFAQIAPKLLFAHAETQLNGARLPVPLARLAQSLPTLQGVVHLGAPAAPAESGLLEETLDRLAAAGAALPPEAEPFPRFPFNQPLFVLFSSGTTGAPKCIVHGHGGTLLEHLKEHRLQHDLRPGDRLLFQTSTGWMMWNWTVSALAAGACVVLYDGSVSFPQPDALLRVAAAERVTVFGTSPAYLQYLVDAGITHGRTLLGAVREVCSTGSVLYPHLHRWAKANLADVPLQSISGGTDLLGCFFQGNPWTGTFEGACSGVGLGLDVRSFGDQGPAASGRGELVCARPFPSKPVGFLNDPGGARFHDAYFAQHPGLWTHGDLIDLSPQGTVRVLGRCDGVLNLRGVRIGPGEIYDVLAAAVPEVTQAMAVDQEAPEEPGGKKLLLFVVLQTGLQLDRPLGFKIKRELKQRASPTHVPAQVVQVEELPTTFSGKRSEAALQDALNQRPVRNRSALRNPDSIERALAALDRLEPKPPAQPPKP